MAAGKTETTGKVKNSERQKRLAEALRANLKKRKTQKTKGEDA